MIRPRIRLDQTDTRLLIGVAALSVAVLWCALLLGLAILIVRTLGGL